MRKYYILLAFLIAGSSVIYSQTGSITNIQVSQQTDNSGIVDVYFDLSGPDGLYYLNMSVSFDGGTTYTPIGSNFLSEDIGPINPGTNKHIIWDGGQSFPDTYSIQSQLIITALKSDCGGTFVDSRDGQTYSTVQIGNQCWMAENLNTTKDAAGNAITLYCYDNNTINCGLYGGLYLWATVMNGAASSSGNPSGVQGICPTGWHVPSDAEWTQLVDYVVVQGFPNTNDGSAGKALRSCRQINSPISESCNTTEHPRWDTYSIYGFDEFGFSALPTGIRFNNGSYNSFGSQGFWWSSTENSNPVSALIRTLSSGSSMITSGQLLKGNGAGVRCLRD